MDSIWLFQSPTSEFSTDYYSKPIIILLETITFTKKITKVVCTGDSLTLKCSFEPHQWLKNGDLLPYHIMVHGSEVNLQQTTEFDSGIYECKRTSYHHSKCLQYHDTLVVLFGGKARHLS